MSDGRSVQRMMMLGLAVAMLEACLPAHAGQSPPEREEPDRAPIPGRNWSSPSTGMEFVWIPAMKMWVGKYEVTNGEYRQKEPGHDSRGYLNPDTMKTYSMNGDRQPVVYVKGFDDAKKYAEWLTERDKAQLGGLRYRLPSEAEWEIFARCGDNRTYPWGNERPPPSGRAGNYHGQEGAGDWGKISGYNDGFPVTAPVDELWANPWELHGVGGNVWEVCASDSSGESLGAWRGTSWAYFHHGDFLRVSYRAGSYGSWRNISAGFRLVLSPMRKGGGEAL